MIFIILLVIVFGMVLSTLQFGSLPDGGSVTAATPRAQVYAVNMETWHQAALLAAQSNPPGVNCTAGTVLPCADVLNPVFWNYGTSQPTQGGTLKNNWAEYVPVVAEGDPTLQNSGGWESFLIKNINGTNAALPGTESYVLTVFRGFGGCTGANCTNAISSNTGSLNNAQIATALAKTIQDRMGVGNLQCTPAACTFTRAAAYIPPGVNAPTTSDLPLQFSTAPFVILQGAANGLPAVATQATVDQVFNNLPAIMTRVSGAAVAAAQTCPAVNMGWDPNGTPVVNYAGHCIGTTPFINSPNGTATIQNTLGDTANYSTPGATVTCTNGTWSGTPSICTNFGGPPSNCAPGNYGWGVGCSANFPGMNVGDPPVHEINTAPGFSGSANATCPASHILNIVGPCS